MLGRFLTIIRELEPNRHFIKLWLSQVLSLTAFNMVNFTLLIRVFELTGSSTFVSLFVLSFGVPSLLFGAVAGAFADRWDRRRVLIVTNLLRTFVVLLYLPALSQLPVIYATTFVIATVTQFFTPAEAALIPELVQRRRLVAANAIFMVTLFTSFVIGYGLSGPLAATGGDQLPIIIAAVMFAIATIACWRLPKSVARIQRIPFRQTYRNLVAHLRAGFQELRQNHRVRYGLLQLTFMWSTIGVVMVVLPAFTSEVLGLSAREVSRLLILPLGVGMLASGYILHRARRRLPVRAVVSISLLGGGLAVIGLGQMSAFSRLVTESHLTFGLSPNGVSEVLTSLMAVILGLSLAITMIAGQTLIHENTAPAIRGRIFGVLGMSINAANTLPILAAGALTDIFKVATVVTMVGIGLVAWSFISQPLARAQNPG